MQYPDSISLTPDVFSTKKLAALLLPKVKNTPSKIKFKRCKQLLNTDVETVFEITFKVINSDGQELIYSRNISLANDLVAEENN